MHRFRRAPYLVIAAAITILDLWSKAGGSLSAEPSRWPWKYPANKAPEYDAALVSSGASLLQWKPTDFPVVEEWINVHTKWNPGAAWSVSLPRWFLLWGTALAVPAIALWILWPKRASFWDTLAKSLVLGGAIGNLYDRWRWDMVRDFIDVCFGDVNGWHYPTFNVADAALVVGIAILLLGGLKKRPAEAA
jgi:signal peptidase II